MSQVIIPNNTSNCISLISPFFLDKTSTNLFLGNISAASDKNLLQEYNITAVLTVAADIHLQLPKHISRKIVAIDDSPLENIAQHFSDSCDFIKKELGKGNVLVHCRAGVSRSATIVAAFLMKQKRYRMQRALEVVKQGRPIIKPNDGFLTQLRHYERKLSKAIQAKGGQLK